MKKIFVLMLSIALFSGFGLCVIGCGKDDKKNNIVNGGDNHNDAVQGVWTRQSIGTISLAASAVAPHTFQETYSFVDNSYTYVQSQFPDNVQYAGSFEYNGSQIVLHQQFKQVNEDAAQIMSANNTYDCSVDGDTLTIDGKEYAKVIE